MKQKIFQKGKEKERENEGERKPDVPNEEKKEFKINQKK
jgi:hypothetical protein